MQLVLHGFAFVSCVGCRTVARGTTAAESDLQAFSTMLTMKAAAQVFARDESKQAGFATDAKMQSAYSGASFTCASGPRKRVVRVC